MADFPFDARSMLDALRAVGERLEFAEDVELVLIGGAAGMLAGTLKPGRTTIDCDVLMSLPSQAMGQVQSIAKSVAAERGLPTHWLNSASEAFADALPAGWLRRKQFVGAFGRLQVFVISRMDLIAMKVIAGRTQDVEDLQAMNVTEQERGFVREHLYNWPHDHWGSAVIREAHALLDALEAGVT